MTHKYSTRVKSCPCCGSLGVKVSHFYDGIALLWVGVVHCAKCGLQVRRGSESAVSAKLGAIRRWNTRYTCTAWVCECEEDMPPDDAEADRVARRQMSGGERGIYEFTAADAHRREILRALKDSGVIE